MEYMQEKMNTFSHVPPGFRFHPTDEELVDYYLRKKINSRRIELDVIKDVDLYKIEPWDLQEICRIGTDDENEWYFFSHKDKKYPTGTRTNRATAAGFWKATGRDKAIYSKHELIGMRKTLVFYKGRAPNGQKSDWIMHEYRLETDENATSQEEGWVVCRVFKKKITTMRKVIEHESSRWYDDQVSLMDSPNHHLSFNVCKKEVELHYHDHFLVQSPSTGLNINQQPTTLQSSLLAQEHRHSLFFANHPTQQTVDQVTDWRVLDKFVASQLSQEDANKGNNNNFPNANAPNNNIFHASHQPNLLSTQFNKQETAPEKASTSTYF